ncbi:MAG: sulfate/molybdate ABC transporter ATP-binding protein [Gemmatimonadota bacterium]
MSITVRRVTKRFGAFEALSDVSLDIPSGELVALLGPSGSGKTTLLRIIAGLETPDQGAVLFDGEDRTALHVRERRVGFVFQHYALFRHMTVYENVAFGLRVRPRAVRPGKAAIDERVRALLRLVQLEWLAESLPARLSGGQRQRVALARALAVEPSVLLLDEPFGALDAQVRKSLRRWLRRLHDELHVTSVFVTHDQEEALEVADRVVVMNEGRIEQAGTPEEVYDHPATAFVFGFLGNVNLFHGRIRHGVAEIGGACIAMPKHDAILDGPAVAYARTHDIHLGRAPGPGAREATVRRIRVLGAVARVELDLQNDGVMEAELPRQDVERLGLVPGCRAYARPARLRVFPGLDSARGLGDVPRSSAAR